MMTIPAKVIMGNNMLSDVDELRRIISERDISTVFQPIVSLRDGSVLGYEALSRGPANTILQPPSTMFNLAEIHGLTWELEYTCRRLSIERFSAFHSEKLLFLNVNPHIITDIRFKEGVTKEVLEEKSIPTSQVVLEITERNAVVNYFEFITAIEHYKSQGFGLGIDDVGAGYSGLNLLCTIRPKYMKLDMALIQGIHLDSFIQQLVKFTVDFARATNISIVAEGIEKEEELKTIIELGVEYGQGFLLAHPNPELMEMSEERSKALLYYQAEKISAIMHQVGAIPVADISRAITPQSVITPCHYIETEFEQDTSLTGIPIISDGKPVGLITRELFFTKLGQQYGYSLYHDRPILNIMNTNPLVVDMHCTIEEAAQLAMQRHSAHVYDQILVSNNGMYFGTVSVRDLLERITVISVERAQYSNPLTGLPGNTMIKYEIERVLFSTESFTILYIDLDHFKVYNDTYGFDRGDEVIKLTASLLHEVFAQQLINDVFIGHIGGDDFMAVANKRISEDLLQHFIEQFDNRIKQMYTPEHAEKGYVMAANRNGIVEKIGLVAVSIAAVTEVNGPFDNYHDIAQRATEVKKNAKAIPGSCYIFDRRKKSDEMISNLCC